MSKQLNPYAAMGGWGTSGATNGYATGTTWTDNTAGTSNIWTEKQLYWTDRQLYAQQHAQQLVNMQAQQAAEQRRQIDALMLRGKPKEEKPKNKQKPNELAHEESTFAWLDRRVDEMRVALA